MYKYIIFDVDGTLLNTEKALLSSLQKVVREDLGKDYSPEELTFALGIPGEITLRKLGIKTLVESNKKWLEYVEDFREQMKIFDGMEDTLVALRNKGIPMGVVTSKTKGEWKTDSTHFDLEKHFNFIVCADDTCKYKPEPEPMLKFIEVSGVKPSEAIYIGDTIYDMKCANGAGVDFALALWGAKSKEGINAKYELQKPGDILDIIGFNS